MGATARLALDSHHPWPDGSASRLGDRTGTPQRRGSPRCPTYPPSTPPWAQWHHSHLNITSESRSHADAQAASGGPNLRAQLSGWGARFRDKPDWSLPTLPAPVSERARSPRTNCATGLVGGGVSPNGQLLIKDSGAGQCGCSSAHRDNALSVAGSPNRKAVPHIGPRKRIHYKRPRISGREEETPRGPSWGMGSPSFLLRLHRLGSPPPPRPPARRTVGRDPTYPVSQSIGARQDVNGKPQRGSFPIGIHHHRDRAGMMAGSEGFSDSFTPPSPPSIPVPVLARYLVRTKLLVRPTPDTCISGEIHAPRTRIGVLLVRCRTGKLAGRGLRSRIRVLLRRGPRIQTSVEKPLVSSAAASDMSEFISALSQLDGATTQRPGRQPHVSGRWGAASAQGRNAHHRRKSRPGYRSAHQHCRQRGAVDRALQINPGPGCEDGNCAGGGVYRVYRGRGTW